MRDSHRAEFERSEFDWSSPRQEEEEEKGKREEGEEGKEKKFTRFDVDGLLAAVAVTGNVRDGRWLNADDTWLFASSARSNSRCKEDLSLEAQATNSRSADAKYRERLIRQRAPLSLLLDFFSLKISSSFFFFFFMENPISGGLSFDTSTRRIVRGTFEIVDVN